MKAQPEENGQHQDTNISNRNEQENENILEQIPHDQFKYVMQQMPAGILIVDAEGRFIFVNNQAEQILRGKYLRKHILDVRDYRAYHKDGKLYKLEDWPLTRTIMKGEVLNDKEILLEWSDGTRRSILASSTPIHNLEGQIIGGVVIFRDITDRKQLEQALQESEERYRHIVELAGEGILVLDSEARVTLANARMAEMFGYSIDELSGKSIFELFPEEEGGNITLRWEERKRGISARLELKMKRKDGSPLWVLASIMPTFDEEKRFTGVLDMETDISRLKQVEERLSSERQIRQTIMENTSAHLAYLDRQFNFIMVNSSFAQGCGLSAEELIGQNYFNLLLNPASKAIFEQVRDTGEPVQFHDMPFVFPEPSERGVTYWDWSLVPVKDASGEVQGLVLSMTETTQQVKAEQQMRTYERLITLGEVTGNISHELRNPLATIDSSAYYLESQLNKYKDLPSAPSHEKIMEHLKRIRFSVSRSTAIIQSLLDLTRMKEPQRKRLDLKACVASLLTELNIPPRIKVIQNFSQEDVFISGDEGQLRLAFENILKNAAQAMEGNGDLTVVICRSQSKAELTFTDTGVGITLENQERIFQPLFSTKANGIGLGLSIARAIIERHGGTIRAKSQAGKGTSIIITLPVLTA